jgi:hypothetical protein
VASTGNIFAGTGENLAGIGATAWTNPGNIVSDNATDATNNGSSSNYLVARNYGLSVPVGATVVGITVRIELSEHSPGAETLNARLQDENGALIGSGKTASVTGTTKTVYTYGSTSDLWGATLTPAIVNDADFGVRFWFTTSHDIRVDYVTLAVEYTEGTATLTGSASTSAVGTATPDTSKAATGESGTASAGSVTQSGQAPLVGSAITSSQGELVRSRGLQIDSAQGSVTPTTALSGSEITSEAGSVSVDTVGFNESLTGSDTTAAQGSPNLGASVRVHSRKVGGGSASRSLSGNAGAVSIGAVTPVPTKTPTSIAALLSAGSVGKDRFKALTGLAVTSTAGTLTSAANVAFALTGPTSGITGVADTYFVTPSAPITGGGATIDITASGATLSTSTLTFSAGATAAQTFTVTRATDGTTSVSIGTTTPGMSVTGTPISYTTQASTDATWTSVPVITFPQGQAAIHDLTQYTDNFDASLHEMQMAEGSNALPTGVTLSAAGSLAYNGTSPEATIVNVQIDIEDKAAAAAEADWQARSTAAGVIQSTDFRSSELALYTAGVFQDDTAYLISRDTSGVALTGGACLRFDIPAALGSGGSGGGPDWRMPLNRSWSVSDYDVARPDLGMGNQAFFVQFRIRFPATYLAQVRNGAGALIATQKKQAIISSIKNSNPGGPTHVLQNNEGFGVVNAYHYDVNGSSPPFHDYVPPFDFDKQNAYKDPVTGARLCSWAAATPGEVPPATCYVFTPDVWMCLMVRLRTLTYGGTTGNEWDYWAWMPGEDTVRSDPILGATRFSHIQSFRDYSVGSAASLAGGFNGIWFGPYDTTRSYADQDQHVLYDQMIVSTSPIACPTL